VSQIPATQTLGDGQEAPVVPQTHLAPTQRSAVGAVQGVLQALQWAESLERLTQPLAQRASPGPQPASEGR
jgi:hypothetical protein